ncbi:MAG TPA: hypothetical protein VG147_11315 [Solirubrobacteraceae bacterium]|jgi:hypothetical protein|nr:hypothetical protein [Solirubrobacteraceae bacterium]
MSGSERMSHDPIDLVRAANPVPDPSADPRSAHASPARRRQVETILHTDPDSRERVAWTAGARPGWRHGARALALLAFMALLTGGAAAAVLLGGTHPSAPLAGVLPEPRQSLGPTSYRIGFAPDISGGHVGWCDQVDFTTRERSLGRGHFERLYGGGASGCGRGPTVAEPFIDADVVSGSGGREGRHFSYQVAYYLTAPEVAAVRASPMLTILTRPEPRLPNGYRVAVGFPQVEHGGSPQAIGAFNPVALDANGHELATRRLPGGTPWVPDPTVSWQRTPQVGLHTLFAIPRSAGRARGQRVLVRRSPPAGPCAIDSSRLHGAQQQLGNVVLRVRPVPQVIGRAYLSCIDTEIADRGWAVDVALLLDAHHPGTLPAPLPGATPVAGHPGVVNEQSGIFGDITGRRVGDAWLVVESSGRLALRTSALPQRLAVLDALRTCVRLHGRC